MNVQHFGEFVELKNPSDPKEIAAAANLLTGRMLARVRAEQDRASRPLNPKPIPPFAGADGFFRVTTDDGTTRLTCAFAMESA